MAKYVITPEINLKKIIAESREMAEAWNEFADNLEQIEKKYECKAEREVSDQMQIVIHISKELYQNVLNGTYCGTLYEALKNGTPLDEIIAEIDDASEIHSDGEFYTKNIDVKRIINKYKAGSEEE